MSNVPKLRFKEFSGEWEIKKLSDVGTFKNGLNKSKEDFGFGFPFVNLMDVFGKAVVPSCGFDLVNANEKDLKLYNLVRGDVLFIRSSVKREGVGETALIMDDLSETTYSGFLIRFREKQSLIDLLYKKYCFKTKRFRNRLISLSTTSANTNINQESLSILTLDLPSKQEQEKIASFLTLVDTKIEQLSRIVELLESYKKGVMQAIFAGGKKAVDSEELIVDSDKDNSKFKIKHLKFKKDDGSEFPEWEEKKLGDIGTVITGKTPSTSNDELWDGNIEFITPTDIEGSKYQTKTSRTVTEQPKMNILPIGTIVYTCIASIGKMSLSTRPSITNQQINSLVVYEQHNNEFVYYALLKLTPYIQSTQANTTLPIINKTEFSKFKVSVPCLEEQTKISNFLSSIDNKIEQTKKQLDGAKKFKKALLQQMFV